MSINSLGPNPECLLVMMSCVMLGSLIDVSECPFSQLQDGVDNIYMLSEYLEDSVSQSESTVSDKWEGSAHTRSLSS